MTEPAAPSPEQNVYDLEPLLTALGGDREIMKTLLATFLRDARRRIDALSGLIQEGGAANAGTIRLHAHSLKGSALNLRAARMTAAAYDLECRASEENLDAAPILFAKIKEEFEKVREALCRDGLAES